MRTTYFICLFLIITSCKKSVTKTYLTKITAKTISVDADIKPSVKIDSIVAPYQGKLKAEMEQVLSYAPKNFLKNDGEMQSSLGNLLADLSFEMGNVVYKKETNQSIDFAMFNHGGIRATMPKGKITTERAFKIMPFENEFVAVTITGKKIMELVDYFIRSKRAHPLSKNIELTIKSDNSYTLKINEKPFDKTKSYTVLTSDFLQSGGDRMNFFKNPEKLTKLNYKVRDAIIDYFKKTDTLQATTDNRVIIK